MASQISRSVCNSNFRYSGDVLSLNHSRFGDYRRIIYPNELDVNDTTDTQKHVSYLDLYLEIDNGERLKANLYDKRDEFTFQIITFPIISSNIPASTAYGVYISQHMRYSRACDFFDRAHLLTQQVLGTRWRWSLHNSNSFVLIICLRHEYSFSLDVNHATQQSINQQNKTNFPSGAPGFTPNLSSYSIFCFLHSVCVSLFVLFLFGYCIVWPSLIYSFWWSLRHLQTFLTRSKKGHYD